MLPKTPMLATATDWSGPTSSSGPLLEVGHDLRGLAHEVDVEPEPREPRLELGQDVGQLVLEVRRVLDELADRRGERRRRLDEDRQQDDHDREVDDDHGAGLGSRGTRRVEPVDQRQQRERQQPGEEEQQQDVAERVEHGGGVPEHDEPERDHREDEHGVDQATLAFGQAVGHGVSLHAATCPGHAAREGQWGAATSAGGATRSPGHDPVAHGDLAVLEDVRADPRLVRQRAQDRPADQALEVGARLREPDADAAHRPDRELAARRGRRGRRRAPRRSGACRRRRCRSPGLSRFASSRVSAEMIVRPRPAPGELDHSPVPLW